MACAGVDFGNKRSVVAIVQHGGVDICCNEVSNRSTPTLVSFGSEERNLGEPAANFAAQLYRSTVGGIQRLLGVDARTPFAQAEAARLTCPVVPHPTSNCASVSVNYSGGEDAPSNGPVIFSYQAIAAMLFSKLMETASDGYKAPVRDCVISVPGYYTDAQRRAILDAAVIANINVLLVINEHAAIALSYGIFRTKELPEKKPIKVAFVDVGESSSSVTIAAFTNSRCDILATVFDANLGGRDLDDILANKFAEEWKASKGIDPMSKPRAKMRLYKECEKLKRILSANAEGHINIECLMNDIDVSGKMTRSELEELGTPLFERLRIICQKAIHEAHLAKDEKLVAVEIVGAGTRVPAIKAIVEETFKPLGAPLRTTLNMDECIARGCALKAAMLSPAFRVRDYTVSDVTPFALKAEKEFASGAPSESMLLVNKYNSLPCMKAMSFKPRGKMTINVKYDDTSLLTQGDAAELLSSFDIDAPEESEGKIRAKIRLTTNGICEMASVAIQKEVEEEEEVRVPKKPVEKPIEKPVEKPAEKPADGPAANGDTEMKDAAADKSAPAAGEQIANGNAEAEVPADGKAAADGKPTATEPAKPPEPEYTIEKRMVKKIKSIDVPFTVAATGCTLSLSDVKNATEKEAKMKANDRYIKERSEAMNSLEAYVYDLRSRIDDSGDLKEFGPADIRAKLRTELDEVENWIYSDEGEAASKSLFAKRRTDLVAKASPMLTRKREFEERPVHINLLQATIESYKKVAVPGLEQYAHISDDDKNILLKCVEEAALWLKAEVEKQNKLPKDVDPVLKCSDVKAKREHVDAVCKPIENKPKPTPKPKEEEKKEDAQEKMNVEAQEDAKDDVDAMSTGESAEEPKTSAETPDKMEVEQEADSNGK